MKNILKLGAIVASLLMSVSAFAGCRLGSCKPCAEPCAPTQCKLPAAKPQCIKSIRECEGIPKYKWECRRIAVPCNGERTETSIKVQPRCLGVDVIGDDLEEGNGEVYAPAKKKHTKKTRSRKVFMD